MKLTRKRVIALLIAALMFVVAIPFNAIFAASNNSVSITLYNDSVLENGSLTPTPHTSSYVWKTDKNTSNVFRLVVNAELGQTYQAGDIELTIDAFSTIGRTAPIIRKSFGDKNGVFVETGTETFNSGIVAENTATINGTASFSITYQIKPEDIKDLGTLNQPLGIKCTMKAGSQTVTSNTISFTTDFEQGWSIINSGEHEEVYDEIEAYKVNNYAPYIHEDRLVTIDGTTVPKTTVSSSNYYWVEYRVPVLSDDPLGIYNHFIEVNIPDGCIFYSAQFEAEDLVSYPESLPYTKDSANNKVTVNCYAPFNSAHSADSTDAYYYIVIALDKSLYSNTNVVTFREKHIHKDDSSVIVYSENEESIDISLDGWTQNNPDYTITSRFGLGVAAEDFTAGYTAFNYATPFSLPVTSNMRINSTTPFVSTKASQSGTKTYLTEDEYDISAVNIPAHYLNDNGETVYGLTYTLYISENNNSFTKYKSETITKDTVIDLPDGINYAYVVYSPTDKNSSINFYTFGSGPYSYRVSPTFTYEFTVNNNTFATLDNGRTPFVGISITGEDNDNRGVRSSTTDFISVEDITKIYRITSEEDTNVSLSGNHYLVYPEYKIDYYSNSIKKDFSSMSFVSVLPSNFYGSSSGSTETVLNTIKKSIAFYSYDASANEKIPFVIEKTNGDGTVTELTVNQNNINDFVTITHRLTNNRNLVVMFDVDFGDYSLKSNFGFNSFLFNFSWPMARLSDDEIGEKKTFDMITALYSDGSFIPAEQRILPPSSNYFSAADNGSFATSVSATSITANDLSDANGNSNTSERAYFAKTNISILDTGESAQSTSIFVETELTPLSFATFANPAKTRSGKEYTLSFVFESYNADYKEIAFFSTLGNHESDGSDWTGTFLSVESVISSLSKNISYSVYYTDEIIDITDSTSNYEGENLLPRSAWHSLASCNDYSTVKTIAVIAKNSDGSSFSKEDVVTCNIRMLSDASDNYNGLYNKAKFGCAGYSAATSTTNEKKSKAFSDFVVIQKYNPTVTYIKRIKADSVNVENGIPTFIVECGNERQGLTFVFRFDKDYDTVDINGVQYYEMSYTVKNELDFGSFVTNEKDSLRYGAPVIQVTEGDGTVNGNNSVSFKTTFDNPDVTIISTSEKEIYRGLSHNDLCVNQFDNEVEA